MPINEDKLIRSFQKVRESIENIQNDLKILKTRLDKLENKNLLSGVVNKEVAGYTTLAEIRALSAKVDSIIGSFSRATSRPTRQGNTPITDYKIESADQPTMPDQFSRLVDYSRPKLVQTQIKKDDWSAVKELVQKLTPKEQKIILTIAKEGKKLSYKDVAVLLEVSPNTVKNHINSVKDKGFPLKEYFDDEGKKRYYLEKSFINILLNKN